MNLNTTMGRIHLDRPIFLFSSRTWLIAALGTVLFGCGGPTRPTVIDPPPTDPPTLTCPTVATASSPSGSPVPVIYADPTIAGGQTPFTLVCSPVSGANYSV